MVLSKQETKVGKKKKKMSKQTVKPALFALEKGGINLDQLNVTLMTYADLLIGSTYMIPVYGKVKAVTTGIYKVTDYYSEEETVIYRSALKEVAEKYNFRVSIQNYNWNQNSSIKMYGMEGLRIHFIPKK